MPNHNSSPNPNNQNSAPPQSRAEYHEEQARLRADRSADRERPASRQER